jgi:site-specific DNA-cytosine methylase
MPTVLIGGTPCVDHSQAGARRRDCGFAIIVFIAFCMKALAWDVPIIIHENVSEFPAEWVHSLLGHAYHIVSIVINTSDVAGCHISRKRRYTLCFHKRKTRFVCNPAELYAAIVAQLSRIQPSISELYNATREDLVAEVGCDTNQVCSNVDWHRASWSVWQPYVDVCDNAIFANICIMNGSG